MIHQDRKLVRKPQANLASLPAPKGVPPQLPRLDAQAVDRAPKSAAQECDRQGPNPWLRLRGDAAGGAQQTWENVNIGRVQ